MGVREEEEKGLWGSTGVVEHRDTKKNMCCVWGVAMREGGGGGVRFVLRSRCGVVEELLR